MNREMEWVAGPPDATSEGTVTEAGIRPPELFAEYQRRVASDIAHYFPGRKRVSIPCVGCRGEGEFAFTKSGFNFRWCPSCEVLWASPRPSAEDLNRFYSSSESARYWADVFSPAVEEVRREQLWKPKVRMLADLVTDLHVTPELVVDIGGGTGVFGEVMRGHTGWPVEVIEPGREAANQARSRGINVHECAFELFDDSVLPAGQVLWTSFELLEHVVDPHAWLRHLAHVMRSGDIALLTTLACTGLDIQLLWERSSAVCPPVHLTFISPRAIELVSAEVGLRSARIFTPGQIDVDIAANNQDAITDRFWRTVLATAGAAERSQWQDLLQRTRRSSHLWALLAKP